MQFCVFCVEDMRFHMFYRLLFKLHVSKSHGQPFCSSLLLYPQHLFKFILCRHHACSPRLSTKERANVSAKPNRGISQYANEKQVISTQYSSCITRHSGRLAAGKMITLHKERVSYYAQPLVKQLSPIFCLTYAVEKVSYNLGISMKMPFLGCKHG